MIAYVDSSVLTRAYLHDEEGHREAVAVLADPEIVVVTGTWTRVEASGTVVRAARAGRCDLDELLRALDEDLDDEGRVTVVEASQAAVEEKALDLVREHGSRAMDAWHLATASLVLPELVPQGEAMAFASRDKRQAEVAATMGFEVI